MRRSYAGPHDMLNSFIWYDSQGNIRAGLNGNLPGRLGEVANYVNVFVATPVAMGALIPPGVLAGIRAAQREKR